MREEVFSLENFNMHNLKFFLQHVCLNMIFTRDMQKMFPFVKQSMIYFDICMKNTGVKLVSELYLLSLIHPLGFSERHIIDGPPPQCGVFYSKIS